MIHRVGLLDLSSITDRIRPLIVRPPNCNVAGRPLNWA